MATDYEVILLNGAAFGHGAGEPPRGDADCDHRRALIGGVREHQGATLTAPNSPLAPHFLKRGKPSQTVGGFASQRVQHG
jgi:hypothetical protein